eukprot:2982335-Pyramimonas_sp.AAC.1
MAVFRVLDDVGLWDLCIGRADDDALHVGPGLLEQVPALEAVYWAVGVVCLEPPAGHDDLVQHPPDDAVGATGALPLRRPAVPQAHWHCRAPRRPRRRCRRLATDVAVALRLRGGLEEVRRRRTCWLLRPADAATPPRAVLPTRTPGGRHRRGSLELGRLLKLEPELGRQHLGRRPLLGRRPDLEPGLLERRPRLGHGHVARR